ncbi:MAG TPA: hypothetical protein VGO58_19735, partial [Chitinophagaceae bacterium]|nr:hypothetical protein [Chitinophagaceae bacterium]
MRKFYFLLLTVLFASISHAQVANYSFAASSGTYTALAGPTNIFTGLWDDGNVTTVPIGFTFTFNGVPYTTCTVNANGYITFGATAPPGGTPYTPLSDATGYSGAVAAYGHDVQAQPAVPAGSVDYLSSGGVFTVQWTNARRYDAAVVQAERINFQIKLIQATNQIVFVYGSWTNAILLGGSGDNATVGGQVGLRGATNADFKNLSVLAAGDWASPTAGAANTASCYYNSVTPATKPASGQTYTFSPPPLCVAPVTQATGLGLTTISTSQINGSFTATAAEGYLVVRYPAGSATTNPANGTAYVAGATLGLGRVVSASSSTSFSATGLTPSTNYDFYVYSYNNLGCTGAPAYNVTAPTTGSQITLACASLAGGTYSVGPTGTYLSLTAATAAIANGASGPVIFELQNAYVSGVETFPILFSSIACPVASVTVRPESGASGLVITSANTTATIDINGANYLTIDGRPGGTGIVSQLTISNTATAGTALRFINDASGNTVRYSTVTGVNTSTTGGVIIFSTTTGTTGNDNNTIDNCDIKDGATTPNNGIFSLGTTTTAALNNSGNIISNNSIDNYFAAAAVSAGVNLSSGNTDWTISGNKLFQSATRTQTTGAQHSGIMISNISGNNFQVIGNTIGFANSAGTGTYSFVAVSGSSVLIPIFLSVGTTTPTSVQGNTIAGIAMSGAGAGTSSSAAFRGIYVASGLAYIGATSAGASGTGNTIGSQSAAGSITYTSSATAASDVIGIFNFGSNNWVVMNNTVGGITAANSSTGAANVYGIRLNTSTTVTTTIQNNTVGGTVANSLQSTSTATGSQVAGIFCSSSNATVTGNTIRNLSAAGGTGTTTAASVLGITFVSTSVNNTVTGNTIHTLTNTAAAAATTLIGIQYTSTTGINLIAKNFIHSFSAASATAIMNGIQVSAGTATYQNNMIRLGIDASGAALTTGFVINGVNEIGGTNNFYFNSVYIGGAGVGGTVNTLAFNSTVTTNTRNFINNIFWNARSNGAGTGKHYAIRVGGTTANPAGLTSNYNVLYATGTGGFTGLFNAVDQATLTAWRTATGQDNSSIAGDPQFINAGGNASATDLHIHATNPSVIEGAGLSIVSVTDDFDGQTRISFTPTDIGADAGNFVINDISAPVIVYSTLGATLCTAIRTVTATITDGTGVNVTAGTKPRIWFKKSGNGNVLPATNDNTTDGWKYTEATNASSPFTLNIDPSLIFGGVAGGDVIQYFVVAQDNATTPNVGINSG